MIENTKRRFGIAQTAWGWVAYAHDGERVSGVHFPIEQKAKSLRAAWEAWPDAELRPVALPKFDKELAAYFKGKAIVFATPVDLDGIQGSRRAIYEACMEIPYGTIVSYGELAELAGLPGAARSVGRAMAETPIPIRIPCHRVIRADGTVAGEQGPNFRVRMLELEGVQCE